MRALEFPGTPWPTIFLVASVGAVAVLGIAFLPQPEPLAAHVEIFFAIGYAGVFLAAQRAGFLLQWRGHATKISIEEFALVGGVILLPPLAFVAAVVASAIANQVLTRRPIEKALFNVGQYALAAAVSVAAFVGLLVAGVDAVWASVSAPFVFSFVSQGTTAFLFAKLEGDRPFRVFRTRFLQWAAVTSVVGASLGLGAYALWRLHPAFLLAILPILVLLARFGRLTEWAEEEVRVHQALADASTRMASTGDFDSVALAIVETCGGLFGAGEARLRMSLRTGEAPSEWRWVHPRGSSGFAMRVVVPTPTGEPGELEVFPRPFQHRFGARDRHLLTIVAGSAASAAATHRAVLELREANQRLTNANRELDEFTLWTTHDMREPLRSVGQLARILREDIEELPAADAKDLAWKIERGADGLKERIKALHEFSRIVQEDVPFETVDLNDVLDSVHEDLAARIAEVRADVHATTRLPTVRGQRARLHKVFANLVENALKYNDTDAPIVEVAAHEAPGGGAWQISVSDNGPGIEPAFRIRAFQLFQRGPGAKPGGSGAGLAIVKRIVEQHGGAIHVDDAPNGGADFLFTLPHAQGIALPVTIGSGAAVQAAMNSRVKELV